MSPTSSIEVSNHLEALIVIVFIILLFVLSALLSEKWANCSRLELRVNSLEQTIKSVRSENQELLSLITQHCNTISEMYNSHFLNGENDYTTLCSNLAFFSLEISDKRAKQEPQSEIEKARAALSHCRNNVGVFSNENEDLRLMWKQLFSINDNRFHEYVKHTPAFTALCAHNTWETVTRIKSALNSNFSMQLLVEPTAQIHSDSGNTYTTTLHSCTCPDFQHRKAPCKHMFYLAVHSGFLSSTDIPKLDGISAKLAELCDSHKKLQALRSDIVKMKNEKSQRYPWLAQLYADLYYVYDTRVAKDLCERKRPALRAADNVKRLSAELREMRSQCKQYEYQLHYLETLFPWLPDFYSAPPTKVYNSITNSDSEENRNSYAAYSDWLSPEEFSRLSDSEKFQLALDRYFKKPKSNWEVGRDYERYIGYLCEMDGYYVHYTGATQKLEDMGRDLLLERGRQLIVVQCKRWAETKTIHENHIFQLFGSAIELSMKYPDKTVIPVFVTTTICSKVARMCAKKLDVRLYENVPMKPYPCIKCNIGNNGEKIYHLPFDQQYDRVMLRAKDGDRYASTTKEAEQMGFRHAYRWHGTT